MARRNRETRLPSPFLKRIVCIDGAVQPSQGYPFDLPWLRGGDFSLDFTTPVTVIVGENGTGKSSLVEAIAALAGYDEAGGGKGYMPVDHSRALDHSGAGLAKALRGSWMPKVTSGWFFRAESFYAVARYLDVAALDDPVRGDKSPPPRFLNWSHGEGFIRFFEERCDRQGVYFMDEPESALSPRRQLELLKLFKRVHESRKSQVIVATHSPLLMAFPDARVLEITRGGIEQVDVTETDHFRLYRRFVSDPRGFIAEALAEEEDGDDEGA